MRNIKYWHFVNLNPVFHFSPKSLWDITWEEHVFQGFITIITKCSWINFKFQSFSKKFCHCVNLMNYFKISPFDFQGFWPFKTLKWALLIIDWKDLQSSSSTACRSLHGVHSSFDLLLLICVELSFLVHSSQATLRKVCKLSVQAANVRLQERNMLLLWTPLLCS